MSCTCLLNFTKSKENIMFSKKTISIVGLPSDDKDKKFRKHQNIGKAFSVKPQLAAHSWFQLHVELDKKHTLFCKIYLFSI